jgi:hypothetical protein
MYKMHRHHDIEYKLVSIIRTSEHQNTSPRVAEAAFNGPSVLNVSLVQGVEASLSL